MPAGEFGIKFSAHVTITQPLHEFLMPKIIAIILLLVGGCFTQDQATSGTIAVPSKADGQKSQIAGQVLDSGTGQPLKKAWVTARQMDRGRRSASSAVTDSEGRFVLP